MEPTGRHRFRPYGCHRYKCHGSHFTDRQQKTIYLQQAKRLCIHGALWITDSHGALGGKHDVLLGDKTYQILGKQGGNGGTLCGSPRGFGR